MKSYSIKNLSNEKILGDNISLADSFFSRMKGLLGRSTLATGEGLIITSCKSIHMVFMKFAIDVIFIDRDDKVVGVVNRIKPYQFSPVFFNANRAIELPAGIASQVNVQLGDQLEILPN